MLRSLTLLRPSITSIPPSTLTSPLYSFTSSSSASDEDKQSKAKEQHDLKDSGTDTNPKPDAENNNNNNSTNIEVEQEQEPQGPTPIMASPPVGWALSPTETALVTLFTRAVALHSPESVVRLSGPWVRNKLRAVSDVALPRSTSKSTFSVLLETSDSLESFVSALKSTISSEEESKGKKSVFTSPLLVDEEKGLVDLGLVQLQVSLIRSTPAEAAHSVDFTVNSLFFNVQSGNIEDWTGVGLEDLATSVLRTPYHPYVTFTAEPLRILTTARLAAAFNFSLEPTIRMAARQPDLHKTLSSTIAKSELAGEIHEMASGPSPFAALSLLAAMNIRHILFPALWLEPPPPPPRDEDGNPIEDADWKPPPPSRPSIWSDFPSEEDAWRMALARVYKMQTSGLCPVGPDRAAAILSAFFSPVLSENGLQKSWYGLVHDSVATHLHFEPELAERIESIMTAAAEVPPHLLSGGGGVFDAPSLFDDPSSSSPGQEEADTKAWMQSTGQNWRLALQLAVIVGRTDGRLSDDRFLPNLVEGLEKKYKM